VRRPLAARSALDSPTPRTRSFAPALPVDVAGSLRSACEALVAAPEELASVSVVTILPPGTAIDRVIAFTELMASEYGCRVHLSVHEGTLDARFDRPTARHA
jgi:hypothetical protein